MAKSDKSIDRAATWLTVTIIVAAIRTLEVTAEQLTAALKKFQKEHDVE